MAYVKVTGNSGATIRLARRIGEIADYRQPFTGAIGVS